MSNFRLFVEKKPSYHTQARNLLSSLNAQFQLNLTALRIINVYDVFNLTRAELNAAKNIVFAEPPVDIISEKFDPPPDSSWFAVELLPGQYDQRADSACQALNLLNIT